MSVFQVLHALWHSPRELLLNRWNWKSAVFSSLIRAGIFFFCNLQAGAWAASGAMLAEFTYRAITAGFCGALTQSFRKARPTWAANLAVVILLPLASHSVEFAVHLLRHTPKLFLSIAVSVSFTVVSTLFNLYAMRRGALIVGEEAGSALDDLKRVPVLIAGFVISGPMELYRSFNRFVMRSPTATRGVVSGVLLAALVASRISGEESRRSEVREYRATAYVSLLSVTIFSRSGVGGGFASLEESSTSNTRHAVLQFLSGSAPERTHGLNRLGYIREEVDERDRALQAVRYFGFITANKEESFSQAKAALDSSRLGDSVVYVAAQGASNQGSAGYSVRNVVLPARYRWTDSEELVGMASSRFAEAPQTRGEERPAKEAADTFLDAIVRAIRTDSATMQTKIIHNGKVFDLRTEKAEDERTGAELQRAGLTIAGGCERLKGTLRAQGAKEETSFRLWYDSAGTNPLPLRFEMRPRSFLRLVFDAVPNSDEQQKLRRAAVALPSGLGAQSFASQHGR